jgi:hypothetical protein
MRRFDVVANLKLVNRSAERITVRSQKNIGSKGKDGVSAHPVNSRDDKTAIELFLAGLMG